MLYMWVPLFHHPLNSPLRHISAVKPWYSGHPWDVANWLLYKGGLIIQCTFNREVLFGTLLGGCFREVTFLYRFAMLDRFHCMSEIFNTLILVCV